MHKPTIKKYGANGILFEWEAVISPKINEEVIRMQSFLNEHHSDWIQEIVPSYQSLLLFLKENTNLERAIDTFRHINLSQHSSKRVNTTWKVPVSYDPIFGLDLESISKTRNLSIEKVIQLHTEVNYRIYGIGFLPGFLYLGGLNEQLFSPRRRVVKRFAPKGSVAIGGEQTGIYPQESPGGWNIIGRTPIELFNPNLDVPTPFSIGDSVRFYEIDQKEFMEIEQQVKQSKYKLTPVSND